MTFVFTWTKELDFIQSIKNISIKELLEIQNSNMEDWQVDLVKIQLNKKEFEALMKSYHNRE